MNVKKFLKWKELHYFYISVTLILCTTPLHASTDASIEAGFFNIAHMVNTPKAIDYAVAVRTNAIEIDLPYDKNGNTLKFTHENAWGDCDWGGIDSEICNLGESSKGTDDMILGLAVAKANLLSLIIYVILKESSHSE